MTIRNEYHFCLYSWALLLWSYFLPFSLLVSCLRLICYLIKFWQLLQRRHQRDGIKAGADSRWSCVVVILYVSVLAVLVAVNSGVSARLKQDLLDWKPAIKEQCNCWRQGALDPDTPERAGSASHFHNTETYADTCVISIGNNEETSHFFKVQCRHATLRQLKMIV